MHNAHTQKIIITKTTNSTGILFHTIELYLNHFISLQQFESSSTCFLFYSNLIASVCIWNEIDMDAKSICLHNCFGYSITGRRSLEVQLLKIKNGSSISNQKSERTIEQIKFCAQNLPSAKFRPVFLFPFKYLFSF